MPTDLNILNNQASKSFDNIKEKTIWRATSANVLTNRPVNRDKIEEVLKATSDSLNNNESRVIELIDETVPNKAKSVLQFLDSIELEPELKIAISYIISSNDKNARANLQKAKAYIERELDKL